MIENITTRKSDRQTNSWSNQTTLAYMGLMPAAAAGILALGKAWQWINSPPDLTEEYEKDVEQRRKEWDRIRSGEEILRKREAEKATLLEASKINSHKKELAERDSRISELEKKIRQNECENVKGESLATKTQFTKNVSAKLKN